MPEKCSSCEGQGFQSGAHTEQVNPCPTCDGTGLMLTDEQKADLPRPDDADRYAIYRVRGKRRDRLVETNLQGIGVAIHALRFPENPDELPLLKEDDRLGIFDRRERRWTLNPWAVG